MNIQADPTILMPSALRRVPREAISRLISLPSEPRVGDIVLARLESIGKNTRLELASGRPCSLHEGDLMTAVFGNRYATSQFEGYARCDGDHCDLLSMGGVCGLVESKHDKVLEPSRLRLLGAVGDRRGGPLSLRDFALPQASPRPQPRVLAVCGSAMDSGKTFTAMSLIVALRRLGHAVAAIKLTGTAAGRDAWIMHDAGAKHVFDFVDGGYPSTYLCSLDELLDLYRLLLGHAAAQEAHWVVLEIADGLLQRESDALLHSSAFTESIEGWAFAASESMAAVAGVELLRSCGVEPLVVSGVISMSPLSMREASEKSGVPCLTGAQIQNGALNDRLLNRVQATVPAAR